MVKSDEYFNVHNDQMQYLVLRPNWQLLHLSSEKPEKILIYVFPKMKPLERSVVAVLSLHIWVGFNADWPSQSSTYTG